VSESLSDPASKGRPPYTSPAPEGLAELAGNVRSLIDRMLRLEDTDGGLTPALRGISESIAELSARLGPWVATGTTPRVGGQEATPDTRPYYIQGPIVGRHHPLVPQIDFGPRDGATRGSVRFGVAFEGPPGCVHGGFVALFFDQILGFENRASGHRGMTGRLEVRYRRPTPLLESLTFEARVHRVSGRKLVTRGALYHADELIAEAEGLFVRPSTGIPRVPRGAE
jgi:acyl-coenzyme A thioesterase PaaI-like protein